jgi:hypothetical protein
MWQGAVQKYFRNGWELPRQAAAANRGASMAQERRFDLSLGQTRWSDQGCPSANVLDPLILVGHPNEQQKVAFLNLDISTTIPSSLVKFCV